MSLEKNEKKEGSGVQCGYHLTPKNMPILADFDPPETSSGLVLKRRTPQAERISRGWEDGDMESPLGCLC